VFENTELIIEDFAQQNEGEEQVILRQMIFASKPQQIQSEIPLIYRSTKSTDLQPHMFTKSVLKPKKR